MENYDKPAHWVYQRTVEKKDRLVLSKKMIRSKAFARLTGAAKQMLLELYMRLTLELDKPGRPQGKRGDTKSYYAKNNGGLVLTYKQIQRMFGYVPSTISKAFDQLVAHGFIEIADLGCGVKRQSHKIALTKNWELYGTRAFKPGKGKADGPVNKGFRKGKDLQKTMDSKVDSTMDSKEVQGSNQSESA